MQTVLFHSTVFGPIHSRRLGVSLGINLLPDDGKICSFDCIYCEAGFNAQGPGTTGFPSMQRLQADLRAKLSEMKELVVLLMLSPFPVTESRRFILSFLRQ